MLAGLLVPALGAARAQTPISYMLYDPLPSPDAEFGRDVHVADLDGDGDSELIVGAPGKMVGAAERAGVLDIKVGPIDGLPGNHGWISITEPVLGLASGPRQWDQFGFRVVSADFNADGYTDLAVSAPGVYHDQARFGSPPQGHWEQGSVFILFGPWRFDRAIPYAAAAEVVEDVLHRNNDFNDSRTLFPDRFGWRIAAGDANADGAADLVVGSPYSEVTDGGVHYYNQVGEAYLYFGPALASWITLELPATHNDPSGSYPSLTDRLWGWDVGCGNITGSGQDEVVVAAYSAENPIGPIYVPNAGWVRVFSDYSSVPPSGFARVFDIRRPAGDVINMSFGWSLAVGRYDGDGYDDLVVGAPFDGLDPLRGEVNVFSGGASFPAQSFAFDRGAAPGQSMDKFGLDVCVLDDQDGDGLAELVIGAPFFSDGSGLVQRQGPGRVFTRHSQTGSQDGIDDPSPEIIRGERYGWGSALCAGRLDGNAALDLVIGNPRATRLGLAKAGEIRIVVH
ncbi:MAG: hypothetical protein U1E76_06285 [Planctomycetota bacterium]